MNDICKLAMFDDLQETAEALRAENDQLREVIESHEKRFKTLAWTLECGARLAKGLPEPSPDEDIAEDSKPTRKRKTP